MNKHSKTNCQKSASNLEGNLVLSNQVEGMEVEGDLIASRRDQFGRRWYTRGEIARALGVKADSVKRCRLRNQARFVVGRHCVMWNGKTNEVRSHGGVTAGHGVAGQTVPPTENVAGQTVPPTENVVGQTVPPTDRVAEWEWIFSDEGAQLFALLMNRKSERAIEFMGKLVALSTAVIQDRQVEEVKEIGEVDATEVEVKAETKEAVVAETETETKGGVCLTVEEFVQAHVPKRGLLCAYPDADRAVGALTTTVRRVARNRGVIGVRRPGVDGSKECAWPDWIWELAWAIYEEVKAERERLEKNGRPRKPHPRRLGWDGTAVN